MKTRQKLQYFFIAVFVLFLVNAIKVFFDNEKEMSKMHGHHTNSNSSILKNNLHFETSLKEYVRFYNTNSEIHYVCDKVFRPKPEDITWHKGVYQKFYLKFGSQPQTDIFAMKFYFDDRFLSSVNQRHVRGFISLRGPGLWSSPQESPDVWEWIKDMHNYRWNVQLWYEGFANPIGVNCKIQGAGGLTKNVSGQFFYQEIITCIIPEIGILPHRVSIVQQPCSKPVTYFEVVYSKSPSLHHQYDKKVIGVCMASWYGSFNKQDLYYFVNWMEALRMFGVTEVTINNSSLKFEDEIIKRAFDYYVKHDGLRLTHYPPVHDEWESPLEDDSAAEGINKLTTNDCVYRNLKRYWYVLIIDLDELPVPTQHATYQEFLSEYTSSQAELTYYHSLSVRSAFFYQNQVLGNPEYKEHLPMLRLTNRFRTEPIDNGVGLAKSFHNMRNMVSAGHHFTRQTHDGGGPKHILQNFIPDDYILIHHYRNSCKYQDYCDAHWNDVIHDDIMVKKYGSQLKRSVENVLQELGVVL